MKIFVGEIDMTDEQAANIIERLSLSRNRFPCHTPPRGIGKNILLMATDTCYKVALGKAIYALRNK